MTSLFMKKDLSDKEYVVKYALVYLGMKKIKDDNLNKLMEDNEDDKEVVEKAKRRTMRAATGIGEQLDAEKQSGAADASHWSRAACP